MAVGVNSVEEEVLKRDKTRNARYIVDKKFGDADADLT